MVTMFEYSRILRIALRCRLCGQLACAGLLCFTASEAQADDLRLEIQGGASYMDSRAVGAFFIEAMGADREIGSSKLSWQPLGSLGWIDRRNIARYAGDRYSTDHATELLAGGARLHWGEPQAWYRPLFFAFEVAYNRQVTQSLCSHYEFISSFGWQGKRFSFQVRHISNGGFHDPNRGETMALIGVRFLP